MTRYANDHVATLGLRLLWLHKVMLATLLSFMPTLMLPNSNKEEASIHVIQ